MPQARSFLAVKIIRELAVDLRENFESSLGGDAKRRFAVPLLGELILWALFLVAVYTPSIRAGSLELIRKIPHSGYSEGLHYDGGFLWNALPTEIVKINPKDGSVVARFAPASAYSESVVWVNGELWNVSYADNGIFKGTMGAKGLGFERKGSVPEIHAWGIEFDGTHLVVTGDYSNKLYFLNPKTLKVERQVTVSVKDLEDLAWDGVGFWASSFTQLRGQIFRINPKTGAVSPYYSLPQPEECPVIDGLAWDGNALWVTGKHCPSIYYVKRPPL